MPLLRTIEEIFGLILRPRKNKNSSNISVNFPINPSPQNELITTIELRIQNTIKHMPKCHIVLLSKIATQFVEENELSSEIQEAINHYREKGYKVFKTPINHNPPKLPQWAYVIEI